MWIINICVIIQNNGKTQNQNNGKTKNQNDGKN